MAKANPMERKRNFMKKILKINFGDFKLYGLMLFIVSFLSPLCFLSFSWAKETGNFYQKAWLRSENNKMIVIDSSDKRSFENIKIKGFRLKYPNKKRCSTATLEVLNRDLELNSFLRTLTKANTIYKKDFKFLRGYPFCKNYHFHFAVLSKVLNEGYTLLKFEERKRAKKRGFFANLFSRS